jgi:hypothetical protein
MKPTFILLIIFNFSLVFGQSGKKDIDYARMKYAEFVSDGINTDSLFVLIDTINKFKILIKENTVYKYSPTQLNIVNQDESGISYMVIFGEDNTGYSSLAKHWESMFRQKNHSFKVSDLRQQNINAEIVEYANIKITINGKKMVGQMKTIQSANRIYILKIMTFKNRLEKYNDRITDILSSFEVITQD